MAEDLVVKRANCVYVAKLAEQAERYDEMADAMKKMVEFAKDTQQELTVEERNLLSVAFKNAVGSRRASWRIVSSVEQKEQSKGNTLNAENGAIYRKKVEAELNTICSDILKLLDEILIPKTEDSESKVFYYKMKGDYHRYISEFTSDDKKEQSAKEADQAYLRATEIAKSDLACTHPIRLGLALNYSVYHYEIRNDCDVACKLAKEAFDDAIEGFDDVSEESYKDSTLIMQLLRDNLTLWTSDMHPEGSEQALNKPSEGG